MNSSKHQLIYVSHATQLFTEDQVRKMAQDFSDKNKKNSLTGILLFESNHFLQLIEGDKYDVHYTFKKIREDKRHKDIHLFLDEPTEHERLFSNWCMMYRSVSSFDPDIIEKVNHLIRNRPTNAREILSIIWNFLKKTA
jgi:hypothetical protein